jgi:hypothetical protein
VEHQKKLDEMVGRRELSFSKEMLGENYILVSVEANSEEYASATVMDLSKRKHK